MALVVVMLDYHQYVKAVAISQSVVYSDAAFSKAESCWFGLQINCA